MRVYAPIALFLFATAAFAESGYLAPPGTSFGDQRYGMRGDVSSPPVPNPVQRKTPKVTGQCSVASDLATLAIPCPDLEVSFVSTKGKELGRSTTYRGKFEIPASAKAEGFVKVLSPKYELATGGDKITRTGDDVIIQVRKR